MNLWTDWAHVAFCYDYLAVFDLLKVCVVLLGVFLVTETIVKLLSKLDKSLLCIHLLKFVKSIFKLSDQLKCFTILVHI